MRTSIGISNRLTSEQERRINEDAVQAFAQRKNVQGIVGLTTLGRRFDNSAIYRMMRELSKNS